MGKKLIKVDARMVGAQGHGIGNYVLDLAVDLAARPLPWEVHYLIAPDCPDDSVLRKLPHTVSTVPFLSPTESLTLRKEIRDADLFHSPSFVSLLHYPCPHVQTVHDLNHRRYGNLAQKFYYQFLLKPSLLKSRAIMTVSESARTELQAWLGPTPIEIAYNAIPPPAPPDESILERLRLKREGYFFCLTNPKRHKNGAMLEAAHTAAGRISLPLVTNLPGEERNNLVRTPSLTVAEISALYQHAHTYFFPSLYEGFGRSPLEAALCGTSAVVSDIPVHREVLAGVVETQFLDPQKPEAWTSLMQRMSGPAKRPASFQSQAWIQEKFSRRNLGDRLVAIYERALAAR